MKPTYVKLSCVFTVVILFFTLNSCRFFGFKGKKSSLSSYSQFDSLPFERAGGYKSDLLDGVHALTSNIPAAPVRPDPDLFGRRLLRQFRSEDSTLSRAISSIEDYKSLLGGASIDFRVAPQESYDATSILAIQRVSEILCQALVAPTAWAQPGWGSILEFGAHDKQKNIVSLFTRLTGKPESDLTADKSAQLQAILEMETTNGKMTDASYTGVCVAILSDTESLLL